MDVDQGPGREGREAPKAGRDANGNLILKNQKNNRGRVLLQSGNQLAADPVGKRFAVAHRVPCVGIQKCYDSFLMLRAAEIGLQNFN